jgi:antitoxin HicB
MNNNSHIGSNFDDFLAEEGILPEVESIAIKRVLAFQIAQEMKRIRLTRTELALRMKTSRASVNRLLDPMNGSVTLQTLGRAAMAVGKKLRVELA